MLKNIVSSLCMAILSLMGGFGGNITVHNTTKSDLFVACYYAGNQRSYGVGGEHACSIISIPANSTATFSRLPMHIHQYMPLSIDNREMICSMSKEAIERYLAQHNYGVQDCVSVSDGVIQEIGAGQVGSVCVVHNIGIKNGKDFYISASNERELCISTSWDWYVANPLFDAGQDIVEMITDPADMLPAIESNPHKNETAYVRVGNELCAGEKNAMRKREPLIHAACEKLVGESLVGKLAPKIAIVTSGGGYRAMMWVRGFLAGAQKIGLLDACMWTSTLSGSSWSVMTLFEQMLRDKSQHNVVAGHNADFFKQLDNTDILDLDADDIGRIVESYLVEMAYNRDTTLVDLFGMLIANKLFGSVANRHRRYLSEHASFLENGDSIIPIYSAVRGEHWLQQQQLDWYEITPWEVGGVWLGCYVPTWAYGREFKSGVSCDNGPEKTCGFHMGTCGSGFAVTVEQLWQELESKIPNKLVCEKIKNSLLQDIGGWRLTHAHIPNFTVGLSQSPVANAESLALIDAGFSFNVAYPAVSGQRPERKADIILCVDASADLKGAPALRGAQEYAQRNGLPFPALNYDGIETRVISVFKDESDLDTPVVVYMPLVNDASLWHLFSREEYAQYSDKLSYFEPDNCTSDDYCNTYNFCYTYQQATQLASLAEFNITTAREKIVDVINGWIRLNNDGSPK